MGSLIKSNIINVLLVGKSPLILKGVTSMLTDMTDTIIVAKASSRIEIIDRIYNNEPHIIILVYTSCSKNIIIETIQLVQETNPKTKILLVIDKQNDSIELIALKMGVKGILYEYSEEAEFIKSIKSIYASKFWIRQEVLEEFVADVLPLVTANKKAALNSLTKRELEIVRFVVKGHKNKEIGEELFLCEKTIKNHLSNIFKKLNIKKRVDLKKYLFHSDL